MDGAVADAAQMRAESCARQRAGVDRENASKGVIFIILTAQLHFLKKTFKTFFQKTSPISIARQLFFWRHFECRSWRRSHT
ncbi:hypothetical protein [Pseudomonas asplenii]|uniref:hypothetical protein n=2 Tax=Pseudomonas TaxID=286 RepID=UPI000AAEDE7C|nr:hypothetical protein [Pseudomonas fuscovaginae]